MIIFKEDTRAYKLVSLLCVVGEYPIASLKLLGSEKHYKRLIKEMSAKQTYHNSATGEKITCVAISVLKSNHPTIRLKLKAIPLMEWVGGAECWQETWGKHHWSGSKSTIERHHRVAEATAMIMQAGIEYRPWKLPRLQTEEYRPDIVRDSSYYISKAFKVKDENDTKQIGFTRFTGVMVSPAECMTVYNARESVMKWGKRGEGKARSDIHEYTKMCCRNGEIRKMVLMSDTFETTMETILQTEKDETEDNRIRRYKKKQSRSSKSSITGLYRGVHFVPLNEFGIKQLKLLSIPDSRQRALELFYDEEELNYGKGEYFIDAYRNDKYIMSYLDGDVARLKQFKESVENERKRGDIYDYAVLCFPEQKEYLKEYLWDGINLLTTNIDAVLQDLTEE